MAGRFVGFDLGAETVKFVELMSDDAGRLRWTRRRLLEHDKQPAAAVRRLLGELEWDTLDGAAVTGRFRAVLHLPRIPTRQALASGLSILDQPVPATIISIGARGFSVLEVRGAGVDVFRENSRCSQGTGNFLRQLVERLGLSIEEASRLCAEVEDPAPLSGRCPVILKTDMTHLANTGEDRARILAGLFDAVCENVQALIKPRLCPPRLLLAGGVTRAQRVRRHFTRFAASNGMQILPRDEDEALYLDALGAACLAAEQCRPLPREDDLFAPPTRVTFDRIPALHASLGRVRRLTVRKEKESGRAAPAAVILGFDIGSTGAKLVALDAHTPRVVWEAYRETEGDPVGAARALMRGFVDGPAGRSPLLACAATGSGREIASSLMATCYGSDRIYVLNEIAAHAEGALHYDGRVDTIFEIGGQDAKYIRLQAGRVVDAAMNEACSAGTGSFIEEQGRKFAGITGVQHLGREALSCDDGVSLGQHCSVFMAEVIDEAVAAGVETPSIIAGLYDSIVLNYLNRVKGPRSIGDVIFCQGMPFSADALAAAVARQTGCEVVVPPSPGAVGALGIALLARRSLALDNVAPLDPRRFLDARVTRKDAFVCKATRGCGGAGNRCRIDRIATDVAGTRQRFTWGGGCSLWDHGTGRRKLPDCAPDPFRERDSLIDALSNALSQRRGRRRIALSDEFQLKDIFPFFATFLDRLGFDLQVHRGADQALLKRGVEGANVPFCAPMQQFHGLASRMAETVADFLFLPMLRGLPRSAGERSAAVCPIAQGSADVIRRDLGLENGTRILSPVIDIGLEGLDSAEFRSACQKLAQALEADADSEESAFAAARDAQRRFEKQRRALGGHALAFCLDNGITPVVVLGRPYTIYNRVLNSNVPALLREQGAVAIPVDCYPVGADVPVFDEVYWGHSQRNLRAAYAIRRSENVYSLWCSNYACGPDSFNLHFYAYLMRGRPFAVIETDGHSGDAGTKTRVEAFLHCVRQDVGARGKATPALAVPALHSTHVRPTELRERGDVVLVQRMGPGTDILVAALRGLGFRAEALPPPDREAVRIGRRYTSGKECVPLCMTLGSLLLRLEAERHSDRRFAFLMPRSTGPCRFGVYHLLDAIVLERLGWNDRVCLWSPLDQDYGDGLPSGVFGLALAGWAAVDTLLRAYQDVRPAETRPGAAQEIYQRHSAALAQCVEESARRGPSVRSTMFEALTGRLFGCGTILRRAAHEFAAVRDPRPMPTVALVGEIYVRCEPYANDFVIDRLQKRGLRVLQAPFNEWLEYADWCARDMGAAGTMGSRLSSAMLLRTLQAAYTPVARRLGWPSRPAVRHSLAAAAPYLRTALRGEAVLTLGSALQEWHTGAIDGVINVGPLECMPGKLAEAQFHHVGEQEGLPSLTISLNGDPMDTDPLEAFVFEVKRRFARGKQARPAGGRERAA